MTKDLTGCFSFTKENKIQTKKEEEISFLRKLRVMHHINDH